jgi:hypothetical protein
MLENSSSMDVMRSSVPIVPIREDQECLPLRDASQTLCENKWRVWSSDFACEPMLLDEMTRRLVQEFQPEQVILAGLMRGEHQIKIAI